MTATATSKCQKHWFRITKDVEYSTDFEFFKGNQIMVARTGKVHNFCSRIEGKSFKKFVSPYKDGDLTPTEKDQLIRSIHSDILNGKHHSKGKFVD